MKKIIITEIHCWYDGPVNGVCEVDSEMCWFEDIGDSSGIEYHFEVYALNEEQIDFLKYWRGEFEKFVVPKGGNFLPTESWGQYYDRYPGTRSVGVPSGDPLFTTTDWEIRDANVSEDTIDTERSNDL